MRLWPKRKDGTGASAAPPGKGRTLGVVTPSPETQRALAAARNAAVDLHKARRMRAQVDQWADEIDAETSKNGFGPLIRAALGSGS